ncbi:MAG TPA: alpha/beta hydrolase, partial [Oxalicibacterium sp.]|nr:alpha/beta hydrolase [Oxalicibacterium sp.]
IRGAESDLLSADTAQVMIRRGPHAELVEVSGTGHAPTLVRPEQIDIVQRFLLS